MRRDAVGFVFQAFHLMDELTAAENVLLPALLAGHSPRAARRQAMGLLEQIGLTDQARHLPSAPSGASASGLLSPARCIAEAPVTSPAQGLARGARRWNAGLR